MTPGSGFVSPYYAPIFGILGTLAGNNACFLKSRFEYDDSLDAFAVHGVAGFVSVFKKMRYNALHINQISLFDG
jgi:Amt family ammonium transporter